MPKKKDRPFGFLRPASDFPTPLFLITASALIGFAAGAWFVAGHL
jgi:hypothetical protein